MPGSGSLFRRADGLWVAQVSSGPRTARRVTRRYARTRREAAAELEKLRAGEAVADSRTTIGDYLRSWLELTGSRRLKASTFETYEIAIRRQLVPHLGSIALASLAPEHVERMVAALERTMSAKGIRNVVSVLGRVLDVAERRDLVKRNVVRLVELPLVRRVEQPTLDVAAARRVLAAVKGDRLEALWVTTIACGLRQAEVLGLRWQDVDLDAATLRVEVVLDRQAGEYVLTSPKTPKSRRTLTLPPFAVTALREHRRRQLAERLAAGVATADGLVFVSPRGRPLSAGWISHRWADLADEIGVDVTFHGLRHAQSSLLVARGVHPKVIAERLGHATITESMDRYAHVPRESDRAAAAELEEALG